MTRYIVRLLCGCLLSLSLSAGEPTGWWQDARWIELGRALEEMSRQRLSVDPEDLNGRFLIEVAEVILPQRLVAQRLRREHEKKAVTPPEAERNDKGFATLLVEHANWIRDQRFDGSSQVAILLGRTALLFDPQLEVAQRLVPPEEMRLTPGELLERCRTVRERRRGTAAERAVEQPLRERLEAVTIPSFELSENGAANLNRLIRTAVDHDLPLRLEFTRTPLVRAGSYRGESLYSVRLQAPTRSLVLEAQSMLRLMQVVCRASGLYWHIDGESVVITDTAADSTDEVRSHGSRQVPVRHAGELHREFARNVAQGLQAWRGKLVRIEVGVTELDKVSWRNKILTCPGMRIDMSRGSQEDLTRCAELMKAIGNAAPDRTSSRTKGAPRVRLQLVVTGEIHNYMSETLHVRNPKQISWELR